MNELNHRLNLSNAESKLLTADFTYESVSECLIGKDYFYKIIKTSDLYKINSALTEKLLNQIPINNSATGFVKGKCYFDFLEAHRKNEYFIRLDIRSFFHNIKVDDVSNAISSYLPLINLKNNKESLNFVLDKLTIKVNDSFKNTAIKDKQIIPIGFKSSPVVSNIVFRKIDIQIQKYCHSHNITYTRYADDMLFSSKKENIIHSSEFIKKISIYIFQLSLKLNTNKTIKAKKLLSLNGYIIDSKTETIRISNKKLIVINKLINMLMIKKATTSDILKKLFSNDIKKLPDNYKNNSSFYQKYCKDQVFNKVVGYRSYLISLIKYSQEHNNCVEKTYINKYTKIIEQLNEIVNKY